MHSFIFLFLFYPRFVCPCFGVSVCVCVHDFWLGGQKRGLVCALCDLHVQALCPALCILPLHGALFTGCARCFVSPCEQQRRANSHRRPVLRCAPIAPRIQSLQQVRVGNGTFIGCIRFDSLDSFNRLPHVRCDGPYDCSWTLDLHRMYSWSRGFSWCFGVWCMPYATILIWRQVFLSCGCFVFFRDPLALIVVVL